MKQIICFHYRKRIAISVDIYATSNATPLFIEQWRKIYIHIFGHFELKVFWHWELWRQTFVRSKWFTPWAYTWEFMVKLCTSSCKSSDVCECVPFFLSLSLVLSRIALVLNEWSFYADASKLYIYWNQFTHGTFIQWLTSNGKTDCI